jgi:hypothetical protein
VYIQRDVLVISPHKYYIKGLLYYRGATGYYGYLPTTHVVAKMRMLQIVTAKMTSAMMFDEIT